MAINVVLHAESISCNHCAMAIKRELSAVDGVLSVAVDVATKNISVALRDEALLAQVKALLGEIGYPVSA